MLKMISHLNQTDLGNLLNFVFTHDDTAIDDMIHKTIPMFMYRDEEEQKDFRAKIMVK